MEFEAARKEFAAEQEAFNAKKKGLLWGVADSEEKLSKEKQFNSDRQRVWEQACERTNRELKAARDELVRLKGEKAKESNVHERAVAIYQKRETEYEHRLANLEKVVVEKTTESKPSKILAGEISADCKWLLARGVPLIADRIIKLDELAKYMFELGEAAFDNGRKEGYSEGRAAVAANEKVDHFELYKGAAVETLSKALGDQDVETEDGGPSLQVLRMNDGYDRLLCVGLLGFTLCCVELK
ncbi:hypothetical protein Hanom_Chr16g01455341 [Helianthus anomalus]